MRNVNSSVIQNFLHFTITQVVPKIVADGYDNHVFLKLFSFELSHLHTSKLSLSIILPQNELIRNIATETIIERGVRSTSWARYSCVHPFASLAFFIAIPNCL